jgi:hypothetical protein
MLRARARTGHVAILPKNPPCRPSFIRASLRNNMFGHDGAYGTDLFLKTATEVFQKDAQ